MTRRVGILNLHQITEQETQLSLTNRATRLELTVKVTKHGTIPYGMVSY